MDNNLITYGLHSKMYSHNYVKIFEKHRKRVRKAYLCIRKQILKSSKLRDNVKGGKKRH